MSKIDFGNIFLTFNIIHQNTEISLQLPNYDTVGDLKTEIFHKLNIPPSRQLIDCWYQSPEDDNDTLKICCQSNVNYLVLYDKDMLKNEEENNMDTSNDEFSETCGAMEECAAIDFIEYFSNNFDDRGLLFHVCRLDDAINQACFTSLESRKILLLYFHNKNDKFAKIFCENLITTAVKETLNTKFFLLGWDVEKEEYHKALIEALSSRTELSCLTHFIESKMCAALLIVPIKDSFTIFSSIRSKVSKKDFVETLKKSEEFLITENQIEKDLAQVEHSVNDMGSVNYQQLMLDLLGDRDYDNFDFYELNLLKEKIGYALYGPPKVETGYDDKQKKRIESLFKVIVQQNNIFAKWKDRIVISFIYNCIEPLPSEKKKRSKKYKDYNPATDLTPVPVFVLRKCKYSPNPQNPPNPCRPNPPNPCRVIIDDYGRVYETWSDYLTRNKLAECEMILPLNGRYQADENGNVMLERHLSPACGIDVKILQGADVANTAAGLISGGIFIAAAIPAITVAPVALVAAGATGIGVGLYSLGRSAYTLYDRSKHKETLSFANSEARGAYLNIVAGSLGFVGAGANMAVSQLAARGFNIGQGASAAVNVLNVANLSASGLSVANSGYDVIDQWWNENQAPSLLTMVQLSSSILFFGHAVYNFRTAGSIIEESQAQTLKDYQDSLRSNRHRKTFNKMLKETIRQKSGDVRGGQAEVIKTIISIQNKDEVFAALTRLNRQMNKNDVKFSADDGHVKLNGVAIDTAKFATMDNNEAAAFLSALPNAPEPSQSEVRVMSSRLQIAFRGVSYKELAALAAGLLKMFGNTEEGVREKIINAVASVVMRLLHSEPGCYRQLGQMFPGIDKLARLFTMVNGYFQSLIDELEGQYQKWLATKDPEYERPKFVDLSLEYSRRVVQLFEVVSQMYFCGNNLTEAGLKELIGHFYTWFAKQALEFEECKKRKELRVEHCGSAANDTICPDCKGVYYR